MIDQDQQASVSAGDELLRAALARARDGLPPASATLTVYERWREPPQQTTLAVTYQQNEAGISQAIVDGACFSLDDPCRLLPVEIGKPWGREIWHTGMEARGEAAVANAKGDASLPLGSYLALAHQHLTGGHTPVLLKILDPLPVPVTGELYLEVHETKQEVYVVTAVDAGAWPDGAGRIRYGVNQSRRRAFADDDAYRAAFLAALNEYEDVRCRIDAGARGLADAETQAREACLTFTDERALEVGDVIRVPNWVPHSLQHGVRVVEFQTPTYERFILSSNQKVLTQDGWDSAHAVRNMQLDTPPQPAPEPVGEHCERIVRFEEFGVWQARLPAGQRFLLPEAAPYAVAFCVSGSASLEGPAGPLTLGNGESALIPQRAVSGEIRAGTDCVLLLAAPGL